MNRVHRRAGVDDDILAIAVHLASDSLAVANRFIDHVESTLQTLADSPRMGSRKAFAHPDLADVRTWWVKDFPNHLIYYLPRRNGIDVLAILHGAQLPESTLHER